MNDYIEATKYIHRGNMIILREALPLNDPESFPSLWLKKFGTLDDFPWEDVFGQLPTRAQMVRAGFAPCPFCDREENKF